MFEQSLYEHQTPVAAPEVYETTGGEMFNNYEIRNWDISSRIYKIIGISAVANILALLIVGQTSLLTLKGCDSPLVGSVCQVLDTVYVGSLLFGTDREYVDAVYEKTELGDAEVTFVDVTGETPPLSYPEGYFQIANPLEYQAMLDAQNGVTDPNNIAGIPPGIPISPPSTGGGSLFDTQPNIPQLNGDVIDGDLPTFNNGGIASNPTPTYRKPPRGRVRPPANKNVKPDEDDTVASDNTNANTATVPNANTVAGTGNSNTTVKVEPTPAVDESQADKFGVYINKRPLRDQATETVDKIDANEVNIASNFKVSVIATIGIGKDGKTVVLKDPKPVDPAKGLKNDPVMEKLVQDWILAVGDAGWFGYIERLDENKKLKAKKVLVTVEQNDTDFFAVIRTEQPDENVARTLSSGLNALLGLAAPAVSGDEQVFLKAATSTSDGKALLLNIHLPKPQVQEMIQRKLAEQKAPPKLPNGNAAFTTRNNLAIK
ncbi:MAG: hypothetical protein WBO10_10465 [Pyrinomonadaceae bacterium]